MVTMTRKYTNEEEQEIAKLYLSGISARKIAKAYETTHATIGRALKRTNTPTRDESERNRKYYINPNTFDIIDTQEKAYWLGFLYADGSTQNKSLSFSLKYSDRLQVVKLKKFLQSDHPIKKRLLGSGGNNKKQYEQAHFYATEKYLINRLKDFGIVVGRGKFTMDEIPKDLYWHWLRGFFDGDGSIGKSKGYPDISFCGEYDVLYWIRNLIRPYILAYCGYEKRKISKHKTANVYYLEYNGINICKPIYEKMYKDATIFLERKYLRFIDHYEIKED